ncbi:MAG: group-specific protein [Lysinibacillus sp.]
MQQYVYHMVPAEMIGDKLIPLNALGKVHPHLYEKYSEKYFDHPERRKLLEKRVPKLNCLWNDVLHFLPLHPHHVYKALKSLDINAKTELPFFKIPIERLKTNKNALYRYSKETYRGPAADLLAEEILLLDTVDYQETAAIPPETVEYFAAEKDKGRPFGMFHFIPHVLSLGEVDIRGVEIITWNRPND